MNKMMSSIMSIGAGMVLYRALDRNGMMSDRNMKRIKKTIKRAMP